MNIRKMISKRGLIGLLILCLLILVLNVAGAQAEAVEPEDAQSSAQNELENRFSDIPTLEYNGVNYRLKNRLTTVLIMGTARETAEVDKGAVRAEFIAMLVVDDNAKTITPVQIDSLTPVAVEGMETAEPMRTLFSAGEDQHISCDMLRQGMNGLLQAEILEHYLSLDIDALEPYDALAVVEEGDDQTPKAVMKRRLEALKAQAESSNSDELNDLFTSLSDHIVTDMKTGAIMKIIDKADRFEVLPSVYVPGVYALENEKEIFVVDEAGFQEIIINTFYEENIW